MPQIGNFTDQEDFDQPGMSSYRYRDEEFVGSPQNRIRGPGGTGAPSVSGGTTGPVGVNQASYMSLQ